MDQMSWIEECAALELDGIELLSNHFPSTERDYLVELKKACTDRFLTIAMISAGGKLGTTDDAARAEEVEKMRRWVEVAEFLGAPRVRFFSTTSAELEAGGADLVAKVKAAVEEIVALGAERGIVMSMENHGVTADELLQLHGDVNSPYFKFALDVGNFPPASQVGPDTYPSIERCASHASIVHAKFFNVLEDGSDRDFDWQKIHEILTGAGFRGFLSVEYEGEDDDEVAVMRRIAKFLKTLR